MFDGPATVTGLSRREGNSPVERRGDIATDELVRLGTLCDARNERIGEGTVLIWISIYIGLFSLNVHSDVDLILFQTADQLAGTTCESCSAH